MAHRPLKPLGIPEFVSLLALMISIIALSIDAMLPALGLIARDFELENPNNAQLVVSAMFLGFAVGQFIAGPLSDSFGRKPIIYIGYVIFIAGCLIAIFSTSFTMLLVGRVLQGLGAAAPRTVGTALVRDGYEGRAMARILSIVMAVFILVPAIAPAIGQGILLLAEWRAIFVALLVSAGTAFVWFAVRQPETLLPSARRTFSVSNIAGGVVEALGYRAMSGYTIAAGICFGAFIGYLNSAQQIFQTTYETGEYFSLYFAAASLSIGVASVYNSRRVMELGMRYLTWRALIAQTVMSSIFVAVAIAFEGVPPITTFMVWLLATFFCFGILFGNFNAMAMEPVGHMAGLGAAIVGAGTTIIALPFGWAVGALFDGTATPLVAGFAVLGALSLLVMRQTETALASRSNPNEEK